MAKRPRKSSGRMASKGFPNPIDVHVGSRIRLRRTLLGMSQERLAEAIGLTVSYFFEDMAPGVQDKTPSKLMGLAHPPAPDYEPDPMAKRETLELVRAYYKIGDPAVRKRIFELTKSVAKSYRADED